MVKWLIKLAIKKNEKLVTAAVDKWIIKRATQESERRGHGNHEKPGEEGREARHDTVYGLGAHRTPISKIERLVAVDKWIITYLIAKNARLHLTVAGGKWLNEHAAVDIERPDATVAGDTMPSKQPKEARDRGRTFQDSWRATRNCHRRTSN